MVCVQNLIKMKDVFNVLTEAIWVRMDFANQSAHSAINMIQKQEPAKIVTEAIF